MGRILLYTPKKYGVYSHFSQERNRAELSALSLGHAQTDELTQHKHLKSALLLWVVLCTQISLYIQLIELMTLSEIGGVVAICKRK